MSMDQPGAARAEYQALEAQISELQKQLLEVKRRLVAGDPQPLADYEFREAQGSVRLSQLFGGHDDLLVIHNMGRSCAYCTLWADGLSGLLPHLESRTAVVLSSPDSPEVQAAFAAERGWNFRMVSLAGSPFATDMGFQEGRNYWPGVSAFRRMAGGGLQRVAADYFGPGDPYCGLWYLLKLLDGGAEGWQPRLSYAVAPPTASA